jgi:hypothetical protein
MDSTNQIPTIDLIEKILYYLPKIDEENLFSILNIINQSQKFGNFKDKNVPNNNFELSYANYIVTKNNLFLLEYEKVVQEACFREFMEWYEYLTKHILRKDVQEVLNIEINETGDWEIIFKQSDIIGWAYQLEDLNIFLKNVDKVEKIANFMFSFFNKRKPLSTLDLNYFESNHAQLVYESIKKVLIEKNIEELHKQILSDKILCMVEVYGWENKFNPILLNWFYENKEKIKLWI